MAAWATALASPAAVAAAADASPSNTATYLFFGVTTAQGGSGAAWGGAGTIYTIANNQSWGQVLVDNGGQSGTNTSWSAMGTIDLIGARRGRSFAAEFADDWHPAGCLQWVDERYQ